MNAIFLGTSGWTYKAWQPDFYPENLPQKQFLRYYSTQLNAVEVNYTFRRRLSEKSIASWLADTPQGFRFTLKAHQGITHFRRLKDAEESVKWFLDAIEPMQAAGRLGAVLFQLPPNMKADPDRLENFLTLLPQVLRNAWEFRHESWFSDRTYAILKKYNAALCIAETEKLTTPEIFTADFVYYRFRLPHYTPSQRRAVAERLQRAKDRAVYAFFKHEESPESALNALDLNRQISREQAA